jgi:hypothetical protein
MIEATIEGDAMPLFGRSRGSGRSQDRVVAEQAFERGKRAYFDEQNYGKAANEGASPRCANALSVGHGIGSARQVRRERALTWRDRPISAMCLHVRCCRDWPWTTVANARERSIAAHR